MMFQGPFKEASENSRIFPEDDVEAFGLLIEWIYLGKVRVLEWDSRASQMSWEPADLYLLAGKIGLDELKDEILDI